MHKIGRAGMVLAGMLVLTVCWIYWPDNSSAENSALLNNPGFEETIKVQYVEGWGHMSAGEITTSYLFQSVVPPERKSLLCSSPTRD